MFALLALLVCSFAFGDDSWISKETFKNEGNVVTLTCVGYASSVELARRFSDESCLSTVSDQLNSSIDSKSAYVQTEKGAWLNDEIKYNQKITGLHCEVTKEKIEEENNAYMVWHQCRFDLKKAVAINSAADREPSQAHELGDKRLVSVSVTPACDSIMIIGSAGRAVDCKQNPVVFLGQKGDKSIIVRSAGYLTKEVPLKDNGTLEQEYEVFLSK